MNDTYELIRINDDGSGYVKFHWADGTSCGQIFSGLPVHDKVLFEAALCDLMQQTHERVNLSPQRVDVTLRATLGQRKPIDDLRNALIAAQSVDMVALKL